MIEQFPLRVHHETEPLASLNDRNEFLTYPANIVLNGTDFKRHGLFSLKGRTQFVISSSPFLIVHENTCSEIHCRCSESQQTVEDQSLFRSHDGTGSLHGVEQRERSCVQRTY